MMPGRSWDKHYRWAVTALLFFCSFLCLEDRVVIFSLLPLIREDLHLSNLETGALMAIFLWTYAAVSPFAGFIGDRLPRKRILIFSVCSWSIVTAGTGLVASHLQILTARCLLGITQAFYIPASFATIADHHTSATRGRALALLGAGASLGPIVGGAAAGWLGQAYGWRMVLYIIGVAGVLLSIVLFTVLRPAVSSTVRESGSLETPLRPSELVGALLGCPTFLILMFTSGVTSLAVWMLTTWLPVFLYQQFHMTLIQSAFLGNFALTGSSLVGAFLGGWLSDAANAKAKQYRLLLFAALFVMACPWPLVFRWAQSATTVLLSVFLFKVFRAMGEANWHPIMYEVIPARMRASAVGISNSFNSVMGGVGALAGGLTESVASLQTIFGMVTFLVAVASVTLLVDYRWFFARDAERAQLPVLSSGAQMLTVSEGVR